jgi:hypothetical protein
MNYNDYDYIYRYICSICVIGVELRSKHPIPVGKDPMCLCNKKMKINSYIGPTNSKMYREEK